VRIICKAPIGAACGSGFGGRKAVEEIDATVMGATLPGERRSRSM
jgi:hypothetical protein